MVNKSLKNVLAQQQLLQSIAKSKPKYQKICINIGDKNLIKAICDICSNILARNIEISEVDRLKLKAYKKTIRELAQDSKISNHSIDKKKLIINQKGGFLNILIPAVVTGIASLIGNFIENRANRPTETQQDEVSN
jgi:hypothetical protein